MARPTLADDDRLTPQERAKVETLRLQRQREHDEFLQCSGCNTVMGYVATLNPGNDQGAGAEYLFQCPRCKRIETRDRT